MIEKYLKILDEVSLEDLIKIYFRGNSDLFINTLTKQGERIPTKLLVDMSYLGFSTNVIKYLSSLSRNEIADFISKMFYNDIKKEGDKYFWYSDAEELSAIFDYEDMDNVIYLLDDNMLKINCMKIWTILSDENNKKLKNVISVSNGLVTHKEVCDLFVSIYNELFYKKVYDELIQNIANFFKIDPKSIKKITKESKNKLVIDITNIMDSFVSQSIETVDESDEDGNYLSYTWEFNSLPLSIGSGSIEFPETGTTIEDMNKFKRLYNTRLSNLIDEKIQKHTNQ